jgi:ribose 1,5-bisphosphokinase PhnN
MSATRSAILRASALADKLFVERAIERDAKHSAENFKAICEADGHVPA